MIHHHPVEKAAPKAEALDAPEADPVSADTSKATLIVKVPADATVYLVGQKMSLTGTERRYRIPVADPGKDYTYPVRVEVVRNGKTLVSETSHTVRGGQQVEVAVAESEDDGELVAVAVR